MATERRLVVAFSPSTPDALLHYANTRLSVTLLGPCSSSYPSSDDQVQLITQSAQRAGFGGGIVVDYPNSRKARKMYLCLMVGQQEVPKGLDVEDMSAGDRAKKRDEIANERRRRRESGRKGKKSKKDIAPKEWILKKRNYTESEARRGTSATFRKGRSR